METTAATATAATGAKSDRLFMDFEPYCVWHRKEDSDTLEVDLSGFKKEQLQVQINNARILTISGQRQLEDNQWSRFRKQIKLADESSENDIRSKFVGGILSVVIPKRAWSISLPSEVLQTGQTAQSASSQSKPDTTMTTRTPHKGNDTVKATAGASGEKTDAELRGMKLGSYMGMGGLQKSRVGNGKIGVVAGLVFVLVLSLAAYKFYVKSAQPFIMFDE